MIKIEIKKALRSQNVKLVLGIGILLAICQTVYFRFLYYPSLMSEFQDAMDGSKMTGIVQPPVLLQGWLGMDFTSFWEHFFYLILPLLAAVPWADSYYLEKHSGYLKQICSRTSRTKYLLSKYVAVFLSGAVAVALPLLLSLYFSSLYLPAKAINSAMFQSGINNTSLWCKDFFNDPVVYALKFIGLDAIYGGLFAALSLLISFWVKKRFTIWTLLFILNLFCYYALRSYVPHLSDYLPYYFLNAESPIAINGVFLIVLGAGLFLITIIGLLFMGKREEIF